MCWVILITCSSTCPFFLSQGIFFASLTLTLLYYGYYEAWYLFAPGAFELVMAVLLMFFKVYLDVVIPRRNAKNAARSTSADGMADSHVEEGNAMV